MSMLEKVKLALRLRNNLFDDEINLYIDACKSNLTHPGINPNKFLETDSAVMNAVICYVKWQMNFQGKAEQWEKIYKDLRLSLVLDSRYK